MEVRLLGPFALVESGREREVTSAGERALLALLATAPGRAFTRDQLIDALWGESPPANPQNALHLRVSKLRKILGDTLATASAGYRLDLAEEDVDAARFVALVRQRRLREALELWRGEPLAEFAAHPWARAVATQLAEVHATAVEDHVDERLAAGDHTALIADLEGFVALEPLRERIRAQHMVALHRSGRTADALAAFQAFRRHLGDELGVEPSAELRSLEMRILRDDPSLAAPRRPTLAVGNLPPPRERLIGRASLLERAQGLVDSRPLLTFTGPGGVGKTALAIALGRRVADRFDGGVWFVPLAAIRDDDQVPEAVAQVLPVADPDKGSAVQLVSAWLSGRSALLILDNCEHLADASATFVDALLRTAGPDLRIVTTSREALAVPGETQVPVPPLPGAAAARLFVERALRTAPGVALTEDDPEVLRICERLDGLPLAIELAAARTKTLPPADLAARLDDRFSLLTTAPRTAEARHQTLRATIDWSHDLLTPRQQALFRRLAVFRGGWTLPAAEAVCDLEGSGDVLDLIGELIDRSLVVTNRGRFRMLETIRVYADERLRGSGELATVAHRHADHYTRFAEQAEPHLRGPTQREWLARLRDEDANLRLAAAWALGHRDDDADLALRLGGALGWYWYVGRQTDGTSYLRDALAGDVGATAEARARALQALSLAVRPVGCIVHPSVDGAEAARASIDLFAQVDDPARVGFSQLLLAVEGVADADATAALALVEGARTTLRAHGDAWGAALADFVEMEIRLHHGEVDPALGLGRSAERAFDRIDDDWGRSAVMLHLGYGLRVAGRLDEAGEVLERAVVLSRDGELPNNLARAASELAEVALDRGDPEGALAWLDVCEGTARDLGNATLLAMTQLGRAGACRLAGDTEMAAVHYRRALDHARGSEFVKGLVRGHAGLAATHLDDGAAEDARPELEQAMTLASRIADPGIAASILELQGRLAAHQGDDRQRRRFEVEAARLRDAHGRPAGALDRQPTPSAPASGRSTS